MSSAAKKSPPDSRTSKSPSQPHQQQRTQPSTSTSYFTDPVSHVVTGLYRRLTEPPPERPSEHLPRDQMYGSGVFTPPRRTASPFQPPPLTPLTLKTSPDVSHQLLTRALAEEIRLLVPPRLQLVNTWQLAYSLDRDGSSLSTLYDKCDTYSHRSQRAGYVLVVRDTSSPSGATGGGGTLFGAYLSDPPRPASNYYGTGECFLWRASTLPGTPVVQVDTKGHTISENGRDKENGDTTLHPHEALRLPGLPPPPSTDTTNMTGRNITFKGEEQRGDSDGAQGGHEAATAMRTVRGLLRDPPPARRSRSQSAASVSSIAGIPVANLSLKVGDSKSGTNTPDQIRFKAFPYSGVNDYMIFCETGFLSVGGGLVVLHLNRLLC